MTAYAIAVIHKTQFDPEIKEYLNLIDETLAPFSGKYLIHGGPYVPLEGTWSSDLVVIGFPSMEHAKGWYESEAYQAIRHLRTKHTQGEVLLVQGVPAEHKASDLLNR
ncbi:MULTISPECIES: DUF1330 domain-containing protein [Acinetobacter]|uniref:DUF1330 domain-containing protein n=2 Tax=Acinetobacter haemolyticus TaxID=29430 RepID=A0AAW4J6N2_ACIHA|nr:MULTISPECIES: DUF1330 domain-containing protein [Acinetobacter]EEH69433.1 hypothetical protein HMPREF0023_1042 [Acinetobacter sp. ATCC 27244]EFF83986.1 hypothetical protein HMP0015_0513 [Acinetobacter haemolyticus ATCC 19194]ENW17882.1 hypothetical protein F926_03273 [Acinetobacter haemolyticus NIPH 261]MBO3658657.1 DUF1330 domain-containing protein [Acinetobacter haemolyticus]NAR49973.1 DUF1330 domain-containing protein [Acinetobacter haemolyticus]